MSVTFESTNTTDTNRIQLQGFPHNMWIYNDAARFAAGNHWSTNLPAVKEEDSTTSSSIGNNSDDSLTADSDDEVQSKDNNININNGLLDSLSDLEKVLPIKRSISTFYAGKSKSYDSLHNAVSVPSIQDIVKPEDAYSRKRKNYMAHQALLDKRCESGDKNGISKRLARTCDRSLPPLPRNNGKLPANESSDSMPSRSMSLSDLHRASSFTFNGSKVDGH